tara:strand:- start:698 stop:940 length:243 start_codon:yes stop_codon:yes gene_type:complete
MSHYECSDCGEYQCVGDCVEREAEKRRRKVERLEELGLTNEDLALLERAVHVIELTLPETSYAKGVLLAELLESIKKRIK